MVKERVVVETESSLTPVRRQAKTKCPINGKHEFREGHGEDLYYCIYCLLEIEIGDNYDE